LSESGAKCLGKAGTLRDGARKIETGRAEHNLKLGDQRHDVSQADKASEVWEENVQKIEEVNHVTLY
jgi:hypothetical protein